MVDGRVRPQNLFDRCKISKCSRERATLTELLSFDMKDKPNKTNVTNRPCSVFSPSIFFPFKRCEKLKIPLIPNSVPISIHSSLKFSSFFFLSLKCFELSKKRITIQSQIIGKRSGPSPLPSFVKVVEVF